MATLLAFRLQEVLAPALNSTDRQQIDLPNKCKSNKEFGCRRNQRNGPARSLLIFRNAITYAQKEKPPTAVPECNIITDYSVSLYAIFQVKSFIVSLSLNDLK